MCCNWTLYEKFTFFYLTYIFSFNYIFFFTEAWFFIERYLLKYLLILSTSRPEAQSLLIGGILLCLRVIETDLRRQICLVSCGRLPLFFEVQWTALLWYFPDCRLSSRELFVNKVLYLFRISYLGYFPRVELHALKKINILMLHTRMHARAHPGILYIIFYKLIPVITDLWN